MSLVTVKDDRVKIIEPLSIRAKERLTDRNSASDREEQELRHVKRGAVTGSILGVLAFLGGLALLGLTFKLAYNMFSIDPATLFGIGKGKALDLNTALTTLMAVLVRILLLMVMVLVGGGVAKHGIHLYADSRHSAKSIVIQRGPDPSNERNKQEEDLLEASRRERLG